MRKKFVASLLILLLIFLSIAIVVLPSFLNKGVSYIELKEPLDLPFLLDEKEDIELVFFGYAGCIKVCTPRLNDIAKWYSSLSKELQRRLRLKFFDLSVPLDKEVPDIFVKSFHKEFKAHFLPAQILREYTKAFSVYFANSLLHKGEIDHTSHLYITKRTSRKKELRGIYTAYPYDFDYITKMIKGLAYE